MSGWGVRESKYVVRCEKKKRLKAKGGRAGSLRFPRPCRRPVLDSSGSGRFLARQGV